ncbi:hypothetical protein J6590_034157 [Homalodisca vitripennis]|nr:hypothetical protein J6590_034157 [Homalodisca vitripennis]
MPGTIDIWLKGHSRSAHGTAAPRGLGCQMSHVGHIPAPPFITEVRATPCRGVVSNLAEVDHKLATTARIESPYCNYPYNRSFCPVI